MIGVSSLVVPLDGSEAATRSLECATWLARRLHARVSVWTATDSERPPRDALRRLRVPERHWAAIELHQTPGPPERAIVEAAGRPDGGLVVLSSHGEAFERAGERDGILGHVARFVIEQSAVPVLLLPPRYREMLPWKHLVVPVSGAPACDDALALATRLAFALDLSVKVVHVANPSASDPGLDARARYADALHHEYPGQLEELVGRALPLLSGEQRQRIDSLTLCGGDVLDQLLELLAREPGGAVVVGWQGTLSDRHAHLLKGLIAAITCPLLLVKPSRRRLSRLNTGEDFGNAAP
jgi:nucleotide-binding universal stress UspA family protein